MIKEALQYLIELGAPNYRALNGQIVTDADMQTIVAERPDNLNTYTLQSVVDYISADLDADFRDHMNPEDKRFIVHVASPKTVTLYAEAATDGERWAILKAKAILPDIHFGVFMPLEQFMIALQTQFVDTPNRAKLIEIASKVVAESSFELTDNGMAQKAVARTGVSSNSAVERIELPSAIMLTPYRTFAEINQPQSPFVLRMRIAKENEIEAALFGVDSADWQIDAIAGIAAWLKDKLGENAVIIS